jgi:hypothetical protein
MESIDKITLELLTNKQQYNKYLSKEDPAKYKEHREYLEKVKKYKTKILNLSKQFLENPETCFNLEMNEMFSIFAKTTIRYIEMRELENENQYNNDREKEEDEMLFEKIDEFSLEEEEEEDDEFENEDIVLDSLPSNVTLPKINTNQSSGISSGISNETMKSYWGKTIKKTDSIPKYTMDMFMNTRHKGF